MTRTLRHATALTEHREFERLDQSLLQTVVELTAPSPRRGTPPSAAGVRCRLWRPDGPGARSSLHVAASAGLPECEPPGPEPLGPEALGSQPPGLEPQGLEPQGLEQPSSDPSPPIAPTGGAAGWARRCLDEGRLLEHADCSPEGQRQHRTWLPVQRQGLNLGVLEINSELPLSAGRLTLVQGMCSLYANHLSLLHDSQVDTLTQLLNRKTFDDSIQRLLNTPQDVERPSWIAVADIDHFKRINDSYGHLFGDEVLLLVAGVLRGEFRQQDKVFRFGGEEFVILLRKVDEQGALAALERFRQAIESRDFPQVGRVTVSIGATRARPGDTACDVLGRADDALYHAKSNGRNQLRVFEHLRADGAIDDPAPMHGEVDLF